MSDAERRQWIDERIAHMVAGRHRWLADLKKRGEKAPCGRKPKHALEPSDPPMFSALDRKAAKADAKRRESAYRRVGRDADAEEYRQAEAERLRAERMSVAEMNRLRNDPHAFIEGETPQERAERISCIGERLARERAQERNAQVEQILRRNGFYDQQRFSLMTRPWRDRS